MAVTRDRALFPMLTRLHRQPDDAETGLGQAASRALAAQARRGMLLLCMAYLVLGTADAIRFAATDLDTLIEHRTTESTALEEADRVVAAMEAAVDAARPASAEEAQAALDAAEADQQTAARRLAAARGDVHRGWGRLGGIGIGIVIIAGVLIHGRRRLRSRAVITNDVTLMILLLGAVLLASRLVVQKALPNVGWGIVDLLVLHLAACLAMPWTARETVLPFGLLLPVWAATFLIPGGSDWEIVDRVVAVIVSPLVLLPGAAIARWRMRRRREDAERLSLADQVESMGGELSRARIVHDAMFPPAFTGHIAFEYEYQPIHEIGGDYVHVHASPETGNVTVTLLDVAGHGLAAALTVNRLFGELERILAENPAATPAEIMTLLNRYIHLTMSPHGLFATGTCMTLDPTSGALTWVNAGHPPCLVRSAGGNVGELPTTVMLLGVLEPEVFDPAQEVKTIRTGDVVIAFTDGAFEARNATGQRFGLERLRETARFDPPPRSWPKFLAGAVAQHHDGHGDDDVLIAALTFRSQRVPDAEQPASALAAIES